MKTSNYLLPHKFKSIGIVILCIAVLFYVISYIAGGSLLSLQLPSFSAFGGDDLGVKFGINKVDLDSTIIIVTTIISLLFIALSKEKIEDECIAVIRAKAFTLTLWITSILLVLTSLFVYDFAYINVLIVNVFAYLALLVIIQKVMIFHFNKTNSDEQ